METISTEETMMLRNADKLHQAMESLENAIKYSRTSEYQGIGLEFKAVLQAAVVQNFSLTFNVCQQMIRHQLVNLRGTGFVEGHAPDAVLRKAFAEGLIDDLDRWLEYLDCEHLTHSSTIPLRTFEKSASFLTDAGQLLQTCVRRENNERRKAA
ncbi:MAG: nucleotidyltransferase substrate binding protein [Planctomycetaceae bacterium]|jgi:hypothetical protein|nr:nucleotidyltransferase substrate binding protein [Planctomycetaceae bacterium]